MALTGFTKGRIGRAKDMVVTNAPPSHKSYTMKFTSMLTFFCTFGIVKARVGGAPTQARAGGAPTKARARGSTGLQGPRSHRSYTPAVAPRGHSAARSSIDLRSHKELIAPSVSTTRSKLYRAALWPRGATAGVSRAQRRYQPVLSYLTNRIDSRIDR